jgi:hypothetical protein
MAANNSTIQNEAKKISGIEYYHLLQNMFFPAGLSI